MDGYLMIGLKLLGSLAMLMYGMKVMSEALQKMAGPQLRHVLGTMTTNRFTSVLAGTIVTATVQSSTATTVMTTRAMTSTTMMTPMTTMAEITMTVMMRATTVRMRMMTTMRTTTEGSANPVLDVTSMMVAYFNVPLILR